MHVNNPYKSGINLCEKVYQVVAKQSRCSESQSLQKLFNPPILQTLHIVYDFNPT